MKRYLSFPKDYRTSEFRWCMTASLRSILVGKKQSAYHRYLVVALALGVFVTSLAAYALGVFSVSGGVVFIPFFAAVVGMLAGCWVGYSRSGLLFAWLVTYTSLLGYHADHAFFGLSGREFGDQLAYFVRSDGLAFLAVEGLVLGTLAFVLGFTVRWGIDSLRTGAATTAAGKRS